ncbi:hypothetical protein U0070_013813, partial [Myodes glareolus]
MLGPSWLFCLKAVRTTTHSPCTVTPFRARISLSCRPVGVLHTGAFLAPRHFQTGMGILPLPGHFQTGLSGSGSFTDRDGNSPTPGSFLDRGLSGSRSFSDRDGNSPTPGSFSDREFCSRVISRQGSCWLLVIFRQGWEFSHSWVIFRQGVLLPGHFQTGIGILPLPGNFQTGILLAPGHFQTGMGILPLPGHFQTGALLAPGHFQTGSFAPGSLER